MLRSIFAVFGGFFLFNTMMVSCFIGLSAAFPGSFPDQMGDKGLSPTTGMLITITIFASLFMFVSGYAAATLAKRAELAHAAALSALLAANGIVRAVVDTSNVPMWFRIGAIVIALILPILGGYVKAFAVTVMARDEAEAAKKAAAEAQEKGETAPTIGKEPLTSEGK